MGRSEVTVAEFRYELLCSFTGPKEACYGGLVVSASNWQYLSHRFNYLGGDPFLSRSPPVGHSSGLQ